jgi:hypothetical protein
VASNKWTSQTPLSNQIVKAVVAERVYYAPADTVYADPTAKLNGADPASPWVDLGIVQGSKVALSYTKETKLIKTGIDNVTRGAYLTGKSAQAVFTLEQFDTTVIAAVSGTAADVVGSPSIGSKIHIGQEDVVYMALLFCGTNKIDGKEFHTYSKKSAVVFAFEEADDARVVKVTADLQAFVPATETVDALFTIYVLA